MIRPLVLTGACTLALAASAAFVVVARAQSRSFPTASEVTPAGMTAQTQEPATGFTGACLLDYMTYEPTLPLICYSPTGSSVQYGSGTTTVSFPAKEVARSYASPPASYDSFQVLLTCYPHNSDGTCPQQSFAVSRSCCGYGANLISLDGKTATGIAAFH
jgi:hypothetical protein